MKTVYDNRADAGRALAELLTNYARRDDVRVLALPRGGVPVAFEVARALDAPLDVLVVRKLGVPVQPELAMGAIASGGAFFLDDDIARATGVSPPALEAVIARERLELARRERAYRGTRGPLDVKGRTVIVVDDGLATGATMKAAAMALRALGPSKIVAALPVAPARGERRLSGAIDEFVCAMQPLTYFGVGQFYLDFTQTSDDEVTALLHEAQRKPSA